MDPSSKASDDLEAVRTITAALAPFKKEEQERIIRWAREKAGLPIPTAEAKITETGPATAPANPKNEAPPAPGSSNIKQFVEQKDPKSDLHFAAVVAYYHRFNAPEKDRKNTITPEDLQEACRKADRERLKHPGQTLINAFHAGLLDRESRGEFGINSVGENLVAMALPEPTGETNRLKNKPSKAKPKPAKGKQQRK